MPEVRAEGSVTRRRVPPGWLLGAGGLCLALVSTLAVVKAPFLLWNASPSSPLGLYWIRSNEDVRIGDTAIAWLPGEARRLADARRYLPAGIPLVKRVAAGPGSRVCAIGRFVTVDGVLVAVRRTRDRAGRPMSWWSGCRALGRGEFLLISDRPNAFDGRYFGITRSGDLLGKGHLLWAR